jgi:hypothetical protein
VGKPEVKRRVGRPKSRWKYNIKMYFKVILLAGGGGGVDWIVLVENRKKWRILVNMGINLGVP